MSKEMELSVIIPAYLEEENLRLILPRLNIVLKKDYSNKYEIFVVDTQSSRDHTKEVCSENNVVYVNREFGDSYGDAIRTGIKFANGKYIIFMDADGSHSPEFIIKMYAYKDDSDVIIASRYVKGGGSDNKKILILMSWMVNFIYSLVLGLKCKDVSNSFKLYRADLLKSINVVEEILFKIKKIKKDMMIKEIPYVFKERMFGNTKRNLVTFIITYMFTLLKLRFFNR
ncbi:glycosyltransferase family 2 protein [bacterium]